MDHWCKDFTLIVLLHIIFSCRSKQEGLLARMQFENKKIHETFEDIDLNDMVSYPFLFFSDSEILDL